MFKTTFNSFNYTVLENQSTPNDLFIRGVKNFNRIPILQSLHRFADSSKSASQSNYDCNASNLYSAFFRRCSITNLRKITGSLTVNYLKAM